MSWKESLPWNWKKGEGSLSGIDESNPFALLQKQMNSVFEDFMSAVGFEGGNKGFRPRVSVTDDEKKIYITAELPGLDQKDVEVTLTKDALTIRGEKKEEHEEKEGRNRYMFERSYGYFQRVIPLTAEVNEDKVDAVFKNGVLKITLDKTAEAQAQTKKITIRQNS